MESCAEKLIGAKIAICAGVWQFTLYSLQTGNKQAECESSQKQPGSYLT